MSAQLFSPSLFHEQPVEISTMAAHELAAGSNNSAAHRKQVPVPASASSSSNSPKVSPSPKMFSLSPKIFPSSSSPVSEERKKSNIPVLSDQRKRAKSGNASSKVATAAAATSSLGSSPQMANLQSPQMASSKSVSSFQPISTGGSGSGGKSKSLPRSRSVYTTSPADAPDDSPSFGYEWPSSNSRNPPASSSDWDNVVIPTIANKLPQSANNNNNNNSNESSPNPSPFAAPSLDIQLPTETLPPRRIRPPSETFFPSGGLFGELKKLGLDSPDSEDAGVSFGLVGANKENASPKVADRADGDDSPVKMSPIDISDIIPGARKPVKKKGLQTPPLEFQDTKSPPVPLQMRFNTLPIEPAMHRPFSEHEQQNQNLVQNNTLNPQNAAWLTPTQPQIKITSPSVQTYSPEPGPVTTTQASNITARSRRPRSGVLAQHHPPPEPKRFCGACIIM